MPRRALPIAQRVLRPGRLRSQLTFYTRKFSCASCATNGSQPPTDLADLGVVGALGGEAKQEALARQSWSGVLDLEPAVRVLHAHVVVGVEGVGDDLADRLGQRLGGAVVDGDGDGQVVGVSGHETSDVEDATRSV